jgi:hypothetical protein
MKSTIKIALLVFFILTVLMSSNFFHISTALGQYPYPPPNTNSEQPSSTPSLSGSYPAPYPAPLFLPTKTYSPTSIPAVTEEKQTFSSINFDISVDGLNDSDVAEFQLVPELPITKKYFTELKIVLPFTRAQNGNQTIKWQNIPVGNYRLILSAPSEYFREPKGYLVSVTEPFNIEKPSSIVVHFDLIPPTKQQYPLCRFVTSKNTANQPIKCMEERLAVLLATSLKPAILPKVPLLDGYYHYSQVYSLSSHLGIRSNITVTNPDIPHGFVFSNHALCHIYAAIYPDQWIETGWAEASWADDKQFVFEYDTNQNDWNVYDDIVIEPGAELMAKVEWLYNNTWQASVVVNDLMHILKTVDVGFTQTNFVANGFETASRITDDPRRMPPAHFSQAMLSNGSEWLEWNSSNTGPTFTNVNPPYEIHVAEEFSDFVAGSPYSYLPLLRR